MINLWTQWKTLLNGDGLSVNLSEDIWLYISIDISKFIFLLMIYILLVDPAHFVSSKKWQLWKKLCLFNSYVSNSQQLVQLIQPGDNMLQHIKYLYILYIHSIHIYIIYMPMVYNWIIIIILYFIKRYLLVFKNHKSIKNN